MTDHLESHAVLADGARALRTAASQHTSPAATTPLLAAALVLDAAGAALAHVELRSADATERRRGEAAAAADLVLAGMGDPTADRSFGPEVGEARRRARRAVTSCRTLLASPTARYETAVPV